MTVRSSQFKRRPPVVAGTCFLMALALGLLWQAQARPAKNTGRTTIRLAHYQLETGARQAFDQIGAAYMQLHPEVEIIQMPVPERIYRNWLVTQLVGETVPDLVEIQLDAETSDDRIARFFTPLSDLAEAPNPYNRGTELEGVRLRETYLDGMKGGYFDNLLDYYAVPISCPTVRMYYNLDLLKKITGRTVLPADYVEFMDLCRRTAAYAARERPALVPVAGSRSNGLGLMIRMFDSQTQRLDSRLAPVGLIYENAAEGSVRHATDYLHGSWSLDSPEIRSGFEMMRAVGGEMQPGFVQSERDESARRFANGLALMISTGSWDAWSLRQQVTFPVGAGPLPYPSVNDPDYGQYTLGAPSEAGIRATGCFGLARSSRHPETAKDFLQFLASRQGNQLWTNASGWPPAIMGTQVTAEIAPFLPVREGYVPGFPPNISLVGFMEVTRCYTVNLHLLLGPRGSTEAFVRAVKPLYGTAVQADLRRIQHDILSQVQGRDSQFAALAWIAREQPEKLEARQRLDQFLQAESLAERRYYQAKMALPRP
ncbi:MAG: transporter substrate-binding protein [Verrucomicrobia bacterium]|nr:transporter substrate-binding protein [Verrucomicrobiota bacterium]